MEERKPSLPPPSTHDVQPTSSASSANTPKIYTYHCLCSTFLLATPYPLENLPQRPPPSLDKARVLPLPSLLPPTTTTTGTKSLNAVPQQQEEADTNNDLDLENKPRKSINTPLPSLLSPSLRPARKYLIVRREDGFERRRVWRCARCGLTVGYEVDNSMVRHDDAGAVAGAGDEMAAAAPAAGAGRVMFLLEGGLVASEDLEGIGESPG